MALRRTLDGGGSRSAAVLTALVVLSAILPAIGTATGVASAAGFVSLSASVGPEQPITGEEFSLSARLSNAADSNGAYEVRRIVVKDVSGEEPERLAKRSGDLGAIRPGSTLERSVGVTVNDTGVHDLRLVVTLESPGGTTRTMTQTMEVRVYQPHPQVEVSATPAIDGEWRTLSLSVSNGMTDAVRNLAVEVDGESVELRTDRKVGARLPAGQTATFEFPANVAENGRHEVTVTLSYTTDDGDRRSVTRTMSTDFAAPSEPSEHPQVSVETESAVDGAWRSMNVTVANGLSKGVRQVAVSVESDDVTFGRERAVSARLPGGSTTEFTFPAKAGAGRHDVTVTLTYVTQNGVTQRVERTVTADFTPPANPGKIRLTGVSVDRSRGGLEITGSVANVGSEKVDSVLLEVVDAENVDPARPQPEYFVGSVEASDFFSFDLNARLSNNRTTIPVRVTYQVDGVERSFVEELEVRSQPSPNPQARSSGGGGLGALAIVFVVVGLAGVLGVGYLGYRFVRG